jgi:hypothetical protein
MTEAMTPELAEKTAPIQPHRQIRGAKGINGRCIPFPTRVPWVMHERAMSSYRYGQSAERMAQRGGFGVLEFVACLTIGYDGDYETITDEMIAKVRDEAEGLTALRLALDAEREARQRAEKDVEAARAVNAEWRRVIVAAAWPKEPDARAMLGEIAAQIDCLHDAYASAIARAERAEADAKALRESTRAYLAYSDANRGDDYFNTDRRRVRLAVDCALDQLPCGHSIERPVIGCCDPWGVTVAKESSR